MKIATAFIAFVAIACASPSFGETASIPMPGDTRLVVFPFDQNNTYTVLARTKSVTDIAFHPEEEVTAMAVGDTAQWIVSKTFGHVFIKPIHPNIATTATIVTSKRTYQLTLRSGPENGPFYQRVSWDYPDILIFQQEQARQVKARVDAEETRLAATIVTPNVALDKLNFDYTMDGEAEWKPMQVFDDGKFTWIRLSKAQEMPAIFLKPENGPAELLNYNMRGQFIVVQRIVPRILMKSGEKEIVITNNKAPGVSRSFFSSWGRP